MYVTHLHGVYCDGVFLYLLVMANFVYIYIYIYIYICGKFIVSMFVVHF